MSDIADQEGVLVMGATNRPFELDAAVRRRFEKRIYIPLPDQAARIRLFQIHMGEEGAHLTAREVKELSEMTQGYSGSDIENACRDALMQPVRDCLRAKYWKRVHINEPNGHAREGFAPCDKDTRGAIELDMMQLTPDTLILPEVQIGHFKKTMESVKSSVSHSEIAMYEQFTQMFGMEGSTSLEGEQDLSEQEQQTADQGNDKKVEMEVHGKENVEPSHKKRKSSGSRGKGKAAVAI